MKTFALGLQPATLLKKTTSQLFYFEFCETFQNKFFKENFGAIGMILLLFCQCISRGGSRATATSKMERFVIIVNGF